MLNPYGVVYLPENRCNSTIFMLISIFSMKYKLMLSLLVSHKKENLTARDLKVLCD